MRAQQWQGAGHGLGGGVVGWHLPVLVVDEERLCRGGVRVVVMMRRMAAGKASGLEGSNKQ